MEFHTIQEFSDRAAAVLQSPDPVVIELAGKVAGVFIPTPDGEVPRDIKDRIFSAATERLHRQRVELGITEEEIEADIQELSKQRRAARSGR